MNAWLNYVGCGFIALSVLACGSKGSEDGDDDEGTGGTNTGGTGTGGTGGGAPTSMLRNPFTTTVEDWKVEYTSAGGAGTVIPVGDVTLAWTGAVGDPDVGALEGTIPYTSASQYVGFGINYAAAVDMSNSILTAHVRVASGLGDPDDLMTNPGGAKLYAKSGVGYCYAAGMYNNITMIGQWMTIRFDLTHTPDYEDPNCATPFDKSDILEIGIQFDTGGTSMSAQEAVVNIDTISY